MGKRILVGLVAVLAASGFSCEIGADTLWEDISRGNTDFRAVLVSPDVPGVIFAGTKRGVLKSADNGATWREVLAIPGKNRKVNFLSCGAKDKNSVYAATGAGLYRSLDQGKNWQRLFRGRNAAEAEGTALAVLPDALYLGTKAGLFISDDEGRSWHKAGGKLDASQILAVVSHPKERQYIYLACADGVFRSETGGRNWERIFSAQPRENGNDTEEEGREPDTEERFSKIRYLSVDPDNAACLYLATSWGVYKSEDRGVNWEALSDYGLLSRAVHFITLSGQPKIYCAAESGIFEFRNGRWEELSFALGAGEVRFLALDSSGNIYAACSKGLFRAKLTTAQTVGKQEIMDFYTRDEPKINEVQKAAVKYAEVEPEKIIRWRKQAAKRAWLPRFSAGVNRDTSDLWHWESGSSTKANDDVLIRGNDTIGWDVTLTWDLADLIWSEAQASIDVRSRLMVELRDDVLDEVTKLYFERLRVKMELDNLSIEDRKKRFEKELRLRELTASIDAFTGGYFSEQIRATKGRT